MAVKKTAKKKVAKKEVPNPKRKESSKPVTKAERADIMKKVAQVLDRKVPGFVMVSQAPEGGKDTHRLIGNRISRQKILFVAMAHCETDPLTAMSTAIEVMEVKSRK